MPIIKLAARSTVVEVELATALSWQAVENLQSITIKDGENEEVVDTTTFSSQGVYEQEAMQRGAGMDLSGLAGNDSVTGAVAPGQARLDVLGAAVGSASVGRIRFRTLGATTYTVWNAVVSGAERGGGNNDKLTWGTSVMRTGPSTTMAVV